LPAGPDPIRSDPTGRPSVSPAARSGDLATTSLALPESDRTEPRPSGIDPDPAGLTGVRFMSPTPDQADDNRDLAALGYRPVLNRTLGGFSAFAAGFSYISILTGVFQMFYVG